jgi:hypothetical protein
MANRYKNLHEKIKRLRKSLDIKTQKEFGEKLDPVVLRGTIAHWETGRSEPSERQITDMANLAEGRKWWWLLYFADDEVHISDDVDYSHLGSRERWITAKDWEDMQYEHAEQGWLHDEEYLQENSNPNKGPYAAVLSGEPDKAPEAARQLIKSKQATKQGITGLPQAFAFGQPIHSLNENQETNQFTARVKFHKETVLNFFNQMTNFEEDKFLDQLIFEGPFRYKADFYDTVSLVQIKSSQAKFMLQFLKNAFGDMLMMQRFAGKRLDKLLILCLDVDNYDTDPRLLEYVSAAKEADIRMMFTNHVNQKEIAEKMVKFVKDCRMESERKQATVNALRLKRGGLLADAIIDKNPIST